MKLPCGFDDAQLTLFWDGELQGEELASAERHLLACADCRSRLESFRQAEEALPLAEGEDPGEAFFVEMTEAVMKGVREEERAAAPTHENRSVLRRLRRSLPDLTKRPGFGITLAAASVGVVMLLVRQSNDPAQVVLRDSPVREKRIPHLPTEPSAPLRVSSKAAPGDRERDLLFQSEAVDRVDVRVSLLADEAPSEVMLAETPASRGSRWGASIADPPSEWAEGKGLRRAKEVFAAHGVATEEGEGDSDELPWARYYTIWIDQGSPSDDRCLLLRAWIRAESSDSEYPSVRQQLRLLDSKCPPTSMWLDVVGNRPAIDE